MIIAAKVAIGRYERNGVRYNKVIHTIHHVITQLSHVVAHDLRLTAVFEKLPATPYPQKILDERFASHCPISSLLGESGRFVV